MSEGGQVAVRADEDVVAASRARELEQRVRELERLLGRKTMEVELLKEALTAARETSARQIRNLLQREERLPRMVPRPQHDPSTQPAAELVGGDVYPTVPLISERFQRHPAQLQGKVATRIPKAFVDDALPSAFPAACADVSSLEAVERGWRACGGAMRQCGPARRPGPSGPPTAGRSTGRFRPERASR